MRWKISLALVLAAALGLAVYVSDDVAIREDAAPTAAAGSPAPNPPGTASTASLSTSPTTSTSAGLVAAGGTADAGEPPKADFMTLARDPEAHDVMLYHGGEPSEDDIERYNAHHILPFNPIVDESCWTEKVDMGTSIVDVERCQYQQQRTQHAYFNLSNEELVARAEYDEVAALVMAERSKADPDARRDWTLRAAALSGKSGPLMVFADTRIDEYLAPNPHSDGPATFFRFDAMADRFVMNEIAKRMGDPRARPDHWRSRIAETFDAEALRELDSTVDATLQRMGAIQLQAKGVDEFSVLRRGGERNA